MKEDNSRVAELKLQLKEALLQIKLLKEENLRLKRSYCIQKKHSGFKRTAEVAGLNKPSSKKLKLSSQLITPEVKCQEELRLAKSEEVREKDSVPEKLVKSERRQMMREMVKEFTTKFLPRYEEHLEKERQSHPKLRTKDGRLIPGNIRFLR